MSTLLYKKGDSHEENGLKCEIGKFDALDVPSQLADGWFLTPEEANGKKAPKPAAAEKDAAATEDK
jgi:hypothetical protein